MSGNTSGSIPLAAPGTGMVSPGVPFVAQDLTLAPLSFRFLTELWLNSGNYAQRLTALEAKMGVTDGSNAAAGQIGEYLAATGSGSPSSGVAVDLATLTLPAGDWDVTGSATFNPSAATMESAYVWVGPTVATPQDPGRTGISSVTAGGVGQLSSTAILAGPVRYSIAAPATLPVHLGVEVFLSGVVTVTANVWIRARRVR